MTTIKFGTNIPKFFAIKTIGARLLTEKSFRIPFSRPQDRKTFIGFSSTWASLLGAAHRMKPYVLANLGI